MADARRRRGPRDPNSPLSVVRLQQSERQFHALTLRQQGLTWEKVAEEAGYSYGHHAARAVQNLIDRAIHKPTQEHVENQIAKLEKMFRDIAPCPEPESEAEEQAIRMEYGIEPGDRPPWVWDPANIELGLKITDQWNKLVGAYKHQVTVKDARDLQAFLHSKGYAEASDAEYSEA